MEFKREDFEVAVSLWKEWNEKINVVSRKDIDCLWEHHILHSLAIAEYASREGIEMKNVLDVGTGGGFPGIPLAIALPQTQFTLCDSIGKKIKVASALSEALGLKNVKCVNARAESIEGGFDYVVSRAVTSLDNFYPWVKNSYSKGILYLKGGDIEAEISELCRKNLIPRTSIKVWPIKEWLNDEYFAEKFVIQIGKK